MAADCDIVQGIVSDMTGMRHVLFTRLREGPWPISRAMLRDEKGVIWLIKRVGSTGVFKKAVVLALARPHIPEIVIRLDRYLEAKEGACARALAVVEVAASIGSIQDTVPSDFWYDLSERHLEEAEQIMRRNNA